LKASKIKLFMHHHMLDIQRINSGAECAAWRVRVSADTTAALDSGAKYFTLAPSVELKGIWVEEIVAETPHPASGA